MTSQTAPASEAHERGHAFLRRKTRAQHDAVEAAFAPFDITTADGLGHFLRAQAAAVTGLERSLDAALMAATLPDWPDRRRTAAVLADLRALGLASPAPSPVDLPTDAHRLGAVYVLEGSRLGGRVLKRLAATSSDPRVRGGVRFLDHQAGSGSWQVLKVRLDTFDADSDAARQLLEGAVLAFALFQDAAERERLGELG